MNSNIIYNQMNTVSDIVNVFKFYKISIFLTTFFFTVTILVFSWLFITPSYEAEGKIQIGQVAGKFIESGLLVEERVKSKSFILDLLLDNAELLEYGKDLSSDERYLQNTLSFKKIKDSDIVTFSLRAHSVDRALLKAEAFVKKIQHEHSLIFETNLDMIRQQVKMTDDRIASIQAADQRMQRNVSNLHKFDSYNADVEHFLTRASAEELRELRDRKFELDSSLNPALSFNTKIFGKIYVSKKPVSPNLTLVGFVAMFAGFCVGLFSAFLRYSLARSNTSF